MKINIPKPIALPSLELPQLPQPAARPLEKKSQHQFGATAEALTRLGKLNEFVGGEASARVHVDPAQAALGAAASGFAGLRAELRGEHVGGHMWAGGRGEAGIEAGIRGVAAEAGGFIGVAMGVTGQGDAGPVAGQGTAEGIAGVGAEAGFKAQINEDGATTVGVKAGAAVFVGAALEGEVTVKPPE